MTLPDYPREYGREEHRLSEPALLLVAKKPDAWEYKLFSQVLTDEIAACAAATHTIHCLAPELVVRLADVSEVLDWVQRQLRDIQSCFDTQKRLIDVDVPKAFREPGQPADPNEIIDAAIQFAQVYRHLIDRTAEVRHVQARDEFANILRLVSEASHHMMRNVEIFCTTLQQQIADASKTYDECKQLQTRRVTLVLGFPDGWDSAFSAECDAIDARRNSLAPVSTPQFTVVELEQGTSEWLEWRQNGIGASDAPTIMGENPWKSAAQLLREKRGPARPHSKNAAMARGVMLEPEARKRYIARTGTEVKPACLQSSLHAWLRASVDGISASAGSVVEIKCGESVYWETSACGRPPDYYYGQLQHILAVTGFASIDFWCYLPGNPELLVPVRRNDNYIERLIATEMIFWDSVRTPPSV